MKKKWTIATVLLLAVALLAVGTWAYFSAVGTADNVITMGSVKLALHDEDGAGQPFTTVSAMPGSAVNKVVYVENVGSGAFYTRVKITPEMVGAEEMRRARRGKLVGKVDFHRVGKRQQRRKKPYEHDGQNKDKGGKRSAVG